MIFDGGIAATQYEFAKMLVVMPDDTAQSLSLGCRRVNSLYTREPLVRRMTER